jgi:hypothetical protein
MDWYSYRLLKEYERISILNPIDEYRSDNEYVEMLK